MKIKKSELIRIIREVITEESEYRAYFKKVAGEKGINPDEIDKLSEAVKKSFFAAVDKGWKAQNEATETCNEDHCSEDHDCDEVHPKKSHEEWTKAEEKVDEKLEFQLFSKGHPGDRIKAKKRQQILAKPEVQENKKDTKKVRLTTEVIRDMIREELVFVMYHEKPSTRSFRRAKRSKKLFGDMDRP